MAVLIALFFTILLLGGGVFFVITRKRLRKSIKENLQIKLFLVKFPLTDSQGKNILEEIGKSEQFFAALSSYKSPIIFELAVPFVGEEIHFYIGVRAQSADVLIRQIHSIWSDAEVIPTEDYTVFNPHGVVIAGKITQKNKFILPIRTYDEIKSDTFLSIVGALGKTAILGEGVALQYIVTPASSDHRKAIHGALRSLREGRPIEETLEGKKMSFSDITDIFEQKKKDEGKKEEKIIDQTAISALETKAGKPLFTVEARIIVSASQEYQAESLFEGLAAGFSQFGAPDRNELKITRIKNPKNLIHKFAFREVGDESMILTSAELASIFHFPTPFTDIPKIKYLKSREAPPPQNLPSEGIVLGVSRYRGEEREIRLTEEDRRRHLYIVGQTGTGKSVFLNSLSGQDIASGKGVCVMDPNGDLIEDVLGRVPPERRDDVIVFDPGDLSRPMGLNMLEYDPKFPEQKTFIVNEILNIFGTLYDLKVAGGPMFEQYFRYALLLLMDDPAEEATLVDVPRVFSDAPYRKILLGKCKDPLTKNFWEKEAEKAGGEASLQNITPYITSKFNTFLANDYVRPIIAQPKSSLNFRNIIDQGKILLVNLPKGKIGDINASLLGMILVGKLTIAAFSRADVAMEYRKDFYLYIDEFQNFITPSIATILSEARKYRLCLTIAHQFIDQLPDNIKSAVFGNVGSLVAFRIGADDAEYLEKQFEPVFRRTDLINIDNLNAHTKLMIRGEVSRGFNIFIPFPPRGDSKIAQAIKELSRLKYGREREDVEREIYRRIRAADNIVSRPS